MAWQSDQRSIDGEWRLEATHCKLHVWSDAYLQLDTDLIVKSDPFVFVVNVRSGEILFADKCPIGRVSNGADLCIGVDGMDGMEWKRRKRGISDLIVSWGNDEITFECEMMASL